MTFKVFDLHLKLIESIRHEERTVTVLKYDEVDSILLVAGAGGVSAWRVFKNLSYNCHVVERIFRFSQCTTWVTQLITELRQDKVYAIVETSVYVLSVKTQRLVAFMQVMCSIPEY
jgi:hypothetical protein